MRSRSKSVLVALVAVFVLSGLSAASALASGAPIVETTPATAIHATEATLNGNVNPNGATTKYYFEYGTTTSYGSKTAEASLLGATKVFPESKSIEGLLSATTYHFRFVATNANGTSDGADAMFTTGTSLPEFSHGEKLGFPIKFQGKTNGGNWVFDNGTFTCSEGSIKGQVTGIKTVNNTKIVFKGCGATNIKCPTGLNGEPEGEVITEALEGSPVYLSKTARTVGILFKAQTGTALAHFICKLDKAEVHGKFLMPITPVNKLAEFFTITSGGVEKYETEAGVTLNATLEDNWLHEGKFFPMQWQFKSEIETINLGEQLEIKA